MVNLYPNIRNKYGYYHHPNKRGRNSVSNNSAQGDYSFLHTKEMVFTISIGSMRAVYPTEFQVAIVTLHLRDAAQRCIER